MPSRRCCRRIRTFYSAVKFVLRVHLLLMMPPSVQVLITPKEPKIQNQLEQDSYVFTDGAGERFMRRIVAGLYRLAMAHPNCRVIFQNLDDRAVLLSAGALRAEQAVLIRGSGVDMSEYRFEPEPPAPPMVLMTAR